MMRAGFPLPPGTPADKDACMARSRALHVAAALGLALAFAGPASATPPTEAQVDR